MTRDEMREQLKKLTPEELYQRALADIHLLRRFPDSRSWEIAEATKADCERRGMLAIWMAAKAMVIEEEEEKRRKELELITGLPGKKA